MKRIIITLVAACISLAAMAHEPYKVYCEVWGSTTTNIIGYIYIDFGQDDISRNWLVDSNGKGGSWKLPTTHMLHTTSTRIRLRHATH